MSNTGHNLINYQCQTSAVKINQVRGFTQLFTTQIINDVQRNSGLRIQCYTILITRWTKPVGCRSNRPRIRPGTVKILNAPWELSQLDLRRDYAKKIDPCRMLVWLKRRTVQTMVKNQAAIGSGQYTLLSGRPVHTGQVLFEFKFTTAQSDYTVNCPQSLKCHNIRNCTVTRTRMMIF